LAELPGIVRGLALHGDFAFVGLSRARPTLTGVPIVEERDHLKCGLWVVDLRTGGIASHLEFCSDVDEVFDVQLLNGIRCPCFFGPNADQEGSQLLYPGDGMRPGKSAIGFTV
jgi:uncharacterized protein (TIGR03032 family)